MATMQNYVQLARRYQHAGKWEKCDKLCARACEKLDTGNAGGPVKQNLILLSCAEGLACFRSPKNRKQHGENCYRRALNVVRQMQHPSWRTVELNTIHEFARELMSADMHKVAVKELNGAMEMLDEMCGGDEGKRLFACRRLSRWIQRWLRADEEGNVMEPHPMTQGMAGAVNRASVLRDLAQAAKHMGSADAAEGGLREAIRLCDAETGKEVDMQAECARRELAYLLMGLDGRAGEAEPLLRKVLEMLQARAAPMTLWLDVRSPLSPLAAAALRCLTCALGAGGDGSGPRSRRGGELPRRAAAVRAHPQRQLQDLRLRPPHDNQAVRCHSGLSLAHLLVNPRAAQTGCSCAA